MHVGWLCMECNLNLRFILKEAWQKIWLWPLLYFEHFFLRDEPELKMQCSEVMFPHFCILLIKPFIFSYCRTQPSRISSWTQQWSDISKTDSWSVFLKWISLMRRLQSKTTSAVLGGLSPWEPGFLVRSQCNSPTSSGLQTCEVHLCHLMSPF